MFVLLFGGAVLALIRNPALLDTLTDIGVNIAVLAALGVTQRTGSTRADPAFALAISGYMLWNGYKIAVEVLEQLLDRELPTEERARIKEALLTCPDV